MSVADPFAYERYRKEQINTKLNSLREKRIQIKTPSSMLPKVNKDLVKDLMEAKPSGKRGAATTGAEAVDRLMQDSRFKQLFTDKEF